MKLGLPDGSYEPTTSTERRSYDLLTEGFGPGFNGTLTVVVDAPEIAREEQEQFGKDVAATLQDFPGVAAVSPAMPNEAGDLWIVQVTPKTGPASDETRDLVTALRDKADELPKDANITAYVTGQTAVNIDTADRLAEALPMYIAVVVGLALLLLMVVFRSILVPLKAAAGFLLSIAASLGITVWIFQDGNLNGLFDVAAAGPLVELPADPADRDPVRARDGLRGVPGVPHARALRALGRRQGRGRPGLHRQRPRGDRGGHDHDGRLRRLHPVAGPDHQVDRPVAGGRHPRRRVHRPAHAGAGRDGAARQARLVDAQARRAARARTSTSRARTSPTLPCNTAETA